jgi:hypothetical protein
MRKFGDLFLFFLELMNKLSDFFLFFSGTNDPNE